MCIRKGFTIIELLIVLGVIMVALGLLLPAYTRVRETSDNLRCMSNMNQVGVITQQYCNDFDGSFPEFFFDFSPGNSGTLVILIQPKRARANGWSYYDESIRQCPSEPSPTLVPVKDQDGNITNEPISWGYNIELLVRNVKDWEVPNYKAPGGIAMFWDGHMNPGDNGNKKQGHYDNSFDFAGQTFDARHYDNTVGNVLFLDGHVEDGRASLERSEIFLTEDTPRKGKGGSSGKK